MPCNQTYINRVNIRCRHGRGREAWESVVAVFFWPLPEVLSEKGDPVNILNK